MNARKWTILIAAVVFLAAAVPVWRLQDEQIYQFQQRHELYRDTLYLPSSEYVKAVSLGYDHFVADYLWLRMIQSFAAGWSRPENADQMMNYLKVITDLDPNFEEVYSFAIMAVGEKGDRYDLVKEVVETGYMNNPSQHRTPYEGAYHAYWQRDDARQAKFYIRLALHDHQVPDFVKRWIPYFDAQDGRYRAAYEFALRNYLTMLAQRPERAEEDVNLLNTRNNLMRVVDEWIRSVIEPQAQAWHERTGEWPTVEQLDEAGAFAGNELPDYAMINAVIHAIMDGTVNSVAPDELEALTRNSIRTWDRLPPSPYAYVPPYHQGYLIWPDSPLESGIVISRAEAVNQIWHMLNFIHEGVRTYREQNPSMPERLEDFMPQFAEMKDPFGGSFTWDPVQGRAATTTFPDLKPEDIPHLY